MSPAKKRFSPKDWNAVHIQSAAEPENSFYRTYCGVWFPLGTAAMRVVGKAQAREATCKECRNLYITIIRGPGGPARREFESEMLLIRHVVKAQRARESAHAEEERKRMAILYQLPGSKELVAKERARIEKLKEDEDFVPYSTTTGYEGMTSRYAEVDNHVVLEAYEAVESQREETDCSEWEEAKRVRRCPPETRASWFFQWLWSNGFMLY